MINRSGSPNLWAISSFFNPCRYQRRLANYREFRRRLAVPLVCVELSCEGQFELRSDDAEILIRVRDGAVLWQKERLLNIAWQHVPKSCRKIAWLDCDVFFASDDWVGATENLLDDFPVVQPYSMVAELLPDTAAHLTPSIEDCAVGYSFLSRQREAKLSHGILRSNMRLARTYTGLAWAARREAFEGLGFYDACVVGSGNRAIFCAEIGDCDAAIEYLCMTPRWADHYRGWASAHFKKVGGRVTSLQHTLYHLWHGDLQNRQYADRHVKFARYDFDPHRDIAIGDSGGWVWTSNKRQMHEYLQRYFKERKEDG